MTTADLEEITYDEFWDESGEFPPLLRLGFSDGPGALITGEPYILRRCAITGKDDYTYRVYTVFENANGGWKYFRVARHFTLHEFKAWADQTMPGVAVCDRAWAWEFLDDRGNLRSDLKIPIRRQ